MAAALRRNQRLKKEYLFRKSLEGKERERHDRKERIKHALQTGKPIPTELRQEADQLKKEMEMDDPLTAKRQKVSFKR